jgi:hypothetical protein
MEPGEALVLQASSARAFHATLRHATKRLLSLLHREKAYQQLGEKGIILLNDQGAAPVPREAGDPRTPNR